MVPPLRFELRPLGLRVRYATNNTSEGWIVNNFLLRAIIDHTGAYDDTSVYLNVSCHYLSKFS